MPNEITEERLDEQKREIEKLKKENEKLKKELKHWRRSGAKKYRRI